MSKNIYICYKEKKVIPEVIEKVRKICNNLNADNINAAPSLVFSDEKLIYGILNPTETIRHSGSNLLLGELYGERSWQKIGDDYPDGNYAIFRATNESLEVVTDALGTRTVWYYKDQSIFIASTSQRAILQFLESFELEEGVIPWVISTGTLGPNFSWDKRIKRIPPDGSLTLDRKTWSFQINSKPVVFNSSEQSDEEHEKELKEKIIGTFNSLNLDFNKWIVSLSGGYDSRAILSLLKEADQPLGSINSVTWGDKKSLLTKDSDATLAGKLAEKMGVENKFYDTGDGSVNEEFSEIIERFLKMGEGRNDKIPAYLDGFKTWKIIYESGHQGVIRGDEVFGYNKIYSSLSVRSFMGLNLCSDYSNLSKYPYISSLEQDLPEQYDQNNDESIDTWRDRLFHLYRIPLIQASLADLKYPFIEQINPFLSREIVYQVRKMPDHLRTNKALFKKIMAPLTPDVPFATRLPPSEELKKIFYKESTVEIIKAELNSENAKLLFPEDFLKKLSNELRIESGNATKPNNLKSWIKDLIPTELKKRIAQKNQSLNLDENKLGFRIYMICRMHRILQSDSIAVKSTT